jgi:hypothetical protein
MNNVVHQRIRQEAPVMQVLIAAIAAMVLPRRRSPWPRTPHPGAASL